MSNQLIAVLQKIVDNSDLITDVMQSGNEYYFRFRGYCWSVLRRDRRDDEAGYFSVFFYPKWNDTTGKLADALGYPSDIDVPMTVYHEGEYYPNGPPNVFSNLYKAVAEKHLGVDAAFRHILSE